MRFVVAILLFALAACSPSRNERLTKEGNLLVARIDSFKNATRRLPESVTELGMEETESGPLYYQKKDSVNYIVWFGTSLGESTIYYSDSKKWEEHYREIPTK